MELFIGNLDYEVTSEILQNLFELNYDSFVSATVVRDHITGQSKKYAFVNLHNEFEAQRAKDELEGYMLFGRAIQIKDRTYKS